MKKIFLFSALILATLLLLPLSVLDAELPGALALQTNTKADLQSEKSETVKVLMSKTGEIKEMSAEDYIFGVVAGEMPALYEKEALKAQAVCAYTFLKWRQKENSNKDYDITDDYTTDQCYISLESAEEKWGDKADEYSEKIKSAINSVKNQTLTYNGEIILSVYHSLSSGKTESAKNVWGKDYPYLQAVESQDDKLAENYTSTKTLTFEEFKNAFKDKAELPENPADYFVNWQRTPSGTVMAVTVGNTEFKGSEIRALLDLKSSNFEAATTDTSITFTVYGYGHGVGMSQNGANQLAKQGKTYKQILKHYYTGCEIMRNS